MEGKAARLIPLMEVDKGSGQSQPPLGNVLGKGVLGNLEFTLVKLSINNPKDSSLSSVLFTSTIPLPAAIPGKSAERCWRRLPKFL